MSDIRLILHALRHLRFRFHRDAVWCHYYVTDAQERALETVLENLVLGEGAVEYKEAFVVDFRLANGLNRRGTSSVHACRVMTRSILVIWLVFLPAHYCFNSASSYKGIASILDPGRGQDKVGHTLGRLFRVSRPTHTSSTVFPFFLLSPTFPPLVSSLCTTACALTGAVFQWTMCADDVEGNKQAQGWLVVWNSPKYNQNNGTVGWTLPDWTNLEYIHTE